jgi:translation elongation factor EF-G
MRSSVRYVCWTVRSLSSHAGALEEFCAGGSISEATLATALTEVTHSGTGLVVLCGSAYHNRGIEPLLDAVVAYLPSPIDRPSVRGTWNGTEQQRAADPTAPFAALAFKVTSTQTGRLTFIRVYSGSIRKAGTVFDANVGRNERIGRILRVQADRLTEVPEAVAGDIVAHGCGYGGRAADRVVRLLHVAAEPNARAGNVQCTTDRVRTSARRRANVSEGRERCPY